MDLKKLIDQFIDSNIEEEKLTGTFDCPTCGTEVLNNTLYCLKCKKKVKKSKDESDATS